MDISKRMKSISRMFSMQFSQLQQYIEQELNNTYYDAFMAKKFLEHLYYKKNYSDAEKELVLAKLSTAMPDYANDLKLNYTFIKTFFPIASNLYTDIRNTIQRTFDNSMFVFLYCIGTYRNLNPDAISMAIDILISAAKEVLSDDGTMCSYNPHVFLTDSLYNRYASTIRDIYEKAIKCGVLREKYDAISFGREKIAQVITEGHIPSVSLELVDLNFEFGLYCGNEYEVYLSQKKSSQNPGYVHSFYKCKICRFCALMDIPDKGKELAFDLLAKQFSYMKLSDTYFFLTGTLPSYIFSIVSLIYTEQIKLKLFSPYSYTILSKGDIRKNMLWGDKISDQDFDYCYSSIVEHDKKKGYFSAINGGEELLIGKWMFNMDMSIIESAKSISFDCRATNRLGESTNFFGKTVFEMVTRDHLKKYNWQVIAKSIKIKENRRTATDIDLLAFKDGVLIVGQLKVANCGRTDYQIWKTRQILKQAQEQALLCIKAIERDEFLLHSIFAKEGFRLQQSEIKHIVPIVVTSSHYFTNMGSAGMPTIIGFDMFVETMYYAQEPGNEELIVRSLIDPYSLYKFSYVAEKTISHIEQDEYKIIYEEYEY